MSNNKFNERNIKEMVINEEDEFRKVVGTFARKKSNVSNKFK